MLTLVRGPKLDVILALVRDLGAVAGDIAECGVYQGGALREIALAAPDRRVIGFDTFEGLPREAWRVGEPHGVGDFGDTSYEAVAAAVSGAENVELARGLFPQSAGPFECNRFALVHIDFDFYQSTRDAIAWFLPRMAPGGAMVFDDVDWKHCPGVRQALDEAGLTVEITAPHQGVYRT